MRLEFTKMQGAGNDYIYINAMNNEIRSPESLSIILSDRHFGIGGDGIILICNSDIADARMRIFNLDGSEGKMCGNGIRCVAKYVYDNDIVKKQDMTIETMSGIKTIHVNTKDGMVTSARVDMGKAELEPAKIPALLQGDSVIARKVNIGGAEYDITCVSMGNPHTVVFVDEPDDIDLPKIGPGFETSQLFPEGVNTEFIKVIDNNTLKMRVWERGSGETLACGTGACAAAVAAVLNGYCKKDEDIKVLLRGGELIIRYTNDTVFMTGGCVAVFEGVVEV